MFAFASALLAGMCLRAPGAAAGTTRLNGSAGAFVNRNFGSYLGSVAPVQGESLDAMLSGGLIDDRLMRYTLGGNLVEGRSLGIAERIHILDAGTQVGLHLFPIKWYQFGLGWSGSRLRLQDGPEFSWSSWSRSWYTEASVRPPIARVPALYARHGNFRYRTTLAATRGEQRRLTTVRLEETFGPRAHADATYELTDTDYLRSAATSRYHRVLANVFSRPATNAVLLMRGNATWHEQQAQNAAASSSQYLSYQALYTHDLTIDDQLQIGEHTSQSRGEGTYLLTNDLQSQWYHRFNRAFRGKTGAEFGHQATDGVIAGFAYQKFREAGILGGDANLPAGGFELDPNYTFTAGTVQVEARRGGSFLKHEATLPLLYAGLEGMPMWLSGFLNLERDASSVPVFRRYRALNYRLDVLNALQGGAGYTSRFYFEAQRSRSEDKILAFRSQLDETRLAANINTTLNPFKSRLGAAYAISWVETLLTRYTVNQVSGAWGYWPAMGLLINHTVTWSRTSYERETPLTRLNYLGEAVYRWRAMEFTSAFRYDTYDRQDADEWGVLFQVKRYFSYGG